MNVGRGERKRKNEMILPAYRNKEGKVKIDTCIHLSICLPDPFS